MIEAITAALVAGAVKAAGDIGSDAAKSAYVALKEYLSAQFAEIDVERLEQDPDNEARRSELVMKLTDAAAASDSELIALAREVLNTLEAANTAPGTTVTADTSQTVIHWNDPGGPMPIFLDIDAKTVLITPFPPGPPVRISSVPIDDLANALSNEVPRNRMLAVMINAQTLRLTFDPEGGGEAFAVTSGELRSHEGNAFSFWFDAVDLSARKGPRTLAAFLLSMPMGAWMTHGRQTFETLQRETIHG